MLTTANDNKKKIPAEFELAFKYHGYFQMASPKIRFSMVWMLLTGPHAFLNCLATIVGFYALDSMLYYMLLKSTVNSSHQTDFAKEATILRLQDFSYHSTLASLLCVFAYNTAPVSIVSAYGLACLDSLLHYQIHGKIYDDEAQVLFKPLTPKK